MTSSVGPSPSVVLFVTDVARLVEFYREVAQMRVLHRERGHAVLAIDGFELVIHGLPLNGSVASDLSVPVVVREDSYMKVCFPVSRIADARETAARLGGAIGATAQEWEARGFRACDGHDPEGNVIQVRETVGTRGSQSI